MTQKSAYTSGETTSQPHVTSTTFMTTMKKTQETYSTDKSNDHIGFHIIFSTDTFSPSYAYHGTFKLNQHGHL